ncbi:hypothetical protein AJ79_01160 [Helicocarpus griseus UAMH5409]|uniref:NACHT domain-containing protein n=1 Tax=Helicocarpus griseus UAMH5409 TaxID=1447875 RepID=A0A2B7Y9J5_9EURO|nr:hypothetical protein AJ79_01160 [Helicocarpus griseus UAMH5409]
MGGLVIKKVLLLAKQDPTCSEIAARIHTLFFLATPHRGADMAVFLSNVLKLTVGHGSKAYANNLAPYSEAIQAINDHFRHAYQGVQLYSFFETISTPIGLIVNKSSAVIELPGEQISHLNADHSNVCKFDSPADNKPPFHHWQESLQGSPKVFWLRGEPASGKSTLAGHVIKYLEDCNRDCSYFFVKDRNAGKSTAAELLCSLAWQMAYSNGIVRQQLLEMCAADVKIDKKDERSTWRTVFASRIFRVQRQHPQYWVIDAIDECANYESFFSFLGKIEEHLPFHIFLTSRPSLAIERLFSRWSISKVAEAITLEVSLQDIRFYLQEHAPYFLAENEQERQELVRIILDKSNGNFLWTNLVVKKIEDAVSKEQVRVILDSVPEEIDDLYRQISTSVMATSQNSRIAKAMLRWTLCSLRPLLVEELKDILKLDTGETLHELEKTAGSICGNLIYVDSESRIQAAHQTVREFFFREGDCHEHRMNKSQEHTRIADVCLQYLSSEEMNPRFRRANASRVRKAARSSFVTYASTYFSDHVSRAMLPNDAQLTTLDNFLMTNSLAWIETIARTRDLTPLTRTAKNLKAYSERRAKYEPLLSPEARNVLKSANDLIYLVAQFGKVLTSSPQAIFHLIPAVCPRNSIIFKAFKPHLRELRVAGLSQTEWDEKLCSIVIPGTRILSLACQDNQFALGTSSGQVYIYHETTFQEKRQITNGEPVRRLCFAAINSYLASAGKKEISLWDTSNGQLLWSIPMRDETLALCFSEDEERKPHHYNRTPIHVDFSVGLGLMGVVYRQRPVSFWGLEEHEFEGQFHHSQMVYPLPYIHDFFFNPNSEIILAVVSYQTGVTTVFDPEVQRTLATVDTDATVLAASPDGTVLATGGGWQNQTTDQFARRLHLGQFEISALAAHHESDFVYCGRENGSVAVYATETGKVTQELFSLDCNIAIYFLEWNQQRCLLAVGDRSGRFVVRKLTRATPGPFEICQPILDHNSSSVIHQILLSPDGQKPLVSTADFDVLWDLESATVVRMRTTTEPHSNWKWASHSNRLFHLAGERLEVYGWAALEQISQPGGIDLGIRESDAADIVIPNQSRYGCLVTSGASQSDHHFSVRLFPPESFPRSSEPSSRERCLESITKDFKLIVGVYKSWLVFLQHSGWHWRNTVSRILVTVTQRGSVVMSVKDEVVVFHNALDFEEKVPVNT